MGPLNSNYFQQSAVASWKPVVVVSLNTERDSMTMGEKVKANETFLHAAIDGIEGAMLAVTHVSLTEDGLFSDYRIQVDYRPRVGGALTATLLGRRASFWLNEKGSGACWSGVILDESVNSFTICAPLLSLKHRTTPRVFVNKTPLEIAEAVIAGGDLSLTTTLRLKHDYPRLANEVQLQENDYDFLRRLLSQWGLYYAYEPGEVGKVATLVITDTLAEANALSLPRALDLALRQGNPHPGAVYTDAHAPRQLLGADSLLLQADDPRERASAISTHVALPEPFGSDLQLHAYHDGARNESVAKRQASRQLAAKSSRRLSLTLTTETRGIRVGQEVSLASAKGASLSASNARYRVLALSLQAKQETDRDYSAAGLPTPFAAGQTANFCRTEVILLPLGTDYAPLPIEQPLLGLQSAQVVGRVGDSAASLDEQGWYWVHYDFDATRKPMLDNQTGQVKARLATPLAGRESGFHFGLLPGSRVLVQGGQASNATPMIVGVLYGGGDQNPVSSGNPHSHTLQTQAENRLQFEDTPDKTEAVLGANQQAATLRVSKYVANPGVSLTSEAGGIAWHAKGIAESTQGDHLEAIGETKQISVGSSDSTVLTKQGKLIEQSGQSLTLRASKAVNAEGVQSLSLKAGRQQALTATHNLRITAAAQGLQAKAPAGKMHFQSSGAFAANSSEGAVTLRTPQASIHVAPSGDVTLYANAVVGASASTHAKGASGKLGDSAAAGPAQPAPIAPAVINPPLTTLQLAYLTKAGQPLTNGFYQVGFKGGKTVSGQLDSRAKVTLKDMPTEPYQVYFSSLKAENAAPGMLENFSKTVISNRQALRGALGNILQITRQREQKKQQQDAKLSTASKTLVFLSAGVKGLFDSVWNGVKAVAQFAEAAAKTEWELAYVVGETVGIDSIPPPAGFTASKGLHAFIKLANNVEEHIEVAERTGELVAMILLDGASRALIEGFAKAYFKSLSVESKIEIGGEVVGLIVLALLTDNPKLVGLDAAADAGALAGEFESAASAGQALGESLEGAYSTDTLTSGAGEWSVAQQEEAGFDFPIKPEGMEEGAVHSSQVALLDGYKSNEDLVHQAGEDYSLPYDEAANFSGKPSPGKTIIGKRYARIVDRDNKKSLVNGSWWLELDDMPQTKAEWRSKFAILKAWNKNKEYVIWEADKELPMWEGTAATQVIKTHSKEWVQQGGGKQLYIPTAKKELPKSLKRLSTAELGWEE